MINIAHINLWDKRAGVIVWDAENNIGTFQFEPNFNLDISPIEMPVRYISDRVFSFPEHRANQTFKGLPGLLADVLPDRYGTTLINEWLINNHRPANSLNPVELLCFIGKRGMGAMEFEPAEPQTPDTSTKIELEELVKIAQEILSNREKFQTRISENKQIQIDKKAIADIIKIGSSAGGARAKAIIAYNPKTQEVRSGQAAAPKGFSHWLLKFDGVIDSQSGISNGYGRIEMAYHLMAKDSGIDMMPCRLLEENGRAHFMTQRFDRIGEKEKLHVQSFCAMRHYDFNNIGAYGYEELFETMRALLLPYGDAEQLYHRMVFNVMARNCDDHTKNFSFIMDKQGIWRLSPAFDVCYAYSPNSYWVNSHSMSINGKRSNITRNDLLTVAKNMNIKKANNIINQIADVVSNWNNYAKKTSVNAALKKEIGKNLLLL